MGRIFGVFLAAALAVALPAPSPAEQVGVVKFGVIAPLTGGAADYGNAYYNGIKLAVEETNQAGGVTAGGARYRLEPVVCDDEFKSDRAVNCGKRLSAEHKVPVIMTPASLSAFPLMGFNEQDRFVIMATSQTPSFTQKGNALLVRYINNTDKTMGPWVDLLARYFEREKTRVESVAIMEVNTELGKSWVDNFTKAWRGKGRTVVGKASYDANATDFYAQLSTLLPKSPDALVLTTVCQPSAIVMKQARELGFKGIFINSQACSGEQLLTLLPQGQQEGIAFEAGPWALGGPEIAAFQARYKAKFNQTPQFISGVAYEGVRFFARAVEVAGTAQDPVKIRAAFPQAVDRVKNMFAMANLDANGDMDVPAYVGFIKGGKIGGYKGQ